MRRPIAHLELSPTRNPFKDDTIFDDEVEMSGQMIQEKLPQFSP